MLSVSSQVSCPTVNSSTCIQVLLVLHLDFFKIVSSLGCLLTPNPLTYLSLHLSTLFTWVNENKHHIISFSFINITQWIHTSFLGQIQIPVQYRRPQILCLCLCPGFVFCSTPPCVLCAATRTELLFKLIFNWRIIALQSGVTFCCTTMWIACCCSVSKLGPTLHPYGLQHARFPRPAPSPGVYSNSCPLSRWYHPTISSSVALFPSIFPSFRVFSKELTLHITWLKYWKFSFSICLSNGYSGLIFFRIDWFDLLAVQGTLNTFLHKCNLRALILWFISYMYTYIPSLWTLPHIHPIPPI